MHVLYICHEYPPVVAGGIGTAVANLARGMAKAGHCVSVMGFYQRPVIEQDKGVTVYRLPAFRRGRLLTWFLLRRELRKQIARLHKGNPIDVVEWPDFDGWFLWPIKGVTDVLKVHGGRISHRVHGFGYHSRLYEYLEVRMMRKIPFWIGVSQWFNDEWRSYTGLEPIAEEIVYNPVDTDLFRPAPLREEKTVFYSGGLRNRKGVVSLGQAARKFLSTHGDAKLVMATFEADLTYQNFLDLVGEAASRVTFLPFMEQAELAPLMARSTVFVMPSLYESCGNGWLEAMSCAVPVVGSNMSCGPEVVADKETGFVADPNNPEDIANKVSILLEKEDLNRRMGEAGRRRALERFSVDVAVTKSEAFYDQCRSARI